MGPSVGPDALEIQKILAFCCLYTIVRLIRYSAPLLYCIHMLSESALLLTQGLRSICTGAGRQRLQEAH